MFLPSWLRTGLWLCLRLLRHWVFWWFVPTPPCPGDSLVQAKFLASVVPALGGAVARHAKVVPLKDNRGFVGALSTLKAVGKAGNELPLVLKASAPTALARLGVAAGHQGREARFYDSELAAEVRRVSPVVPEVYYARASGLEGYVVLMEDLKADTANSTSVNMIFGNQVWGVTEPTDKDPIDTLKLIGASVAPFHAAFWKRRGLDKIPWLKYNDWRAGKSRASWEKGVGISRGLWTKNRASPEFTAYADPALIKLIDDCYARSSWEAFQAYLKAEEDPWTLCHGDFHASNMILQGSTPKVFDWSEVGVWVPTHDLGQMWISDVQPHLFDKTEEVLRVWYDALVSSGVDGSSFSFEQAYQSFQVGAVERWVWVFSIMPAFVPIDSPLMKYFHQQILAFAKAHAGLEYPYQVGSVAVF